MPDAEETLSANAILDLRAAPDEWWSVICGLRTVVRAILTLQHAGVGQVTLVGELAERAVAEFRRHSGHRIEVGITNEVAEPDGATSLLFTTPVVFARATVRALIERGDGQRVEVPSTLPEGVPGFLTGASGRDQRLEAGRQIRRFCRKPMLQSGLASVTLLQPIGLQICRLLSRTPITPNMLTILGFMIGLAALPLLWHGGKIEIVIAASLLFLNNLLDQLDGEIARMKFQFSPLGDKLDHSLDEIFKMLILAPMGVGLTHATGQDIWMILGWVGTGARLAYVAVLQYYVWRFGGTTSTTTNFRFWYRVRSPGAAPVKPPPAGDDSKIRARYFLRKDFVFTLYFVFGLFHWLVVPFLLSVFGAIEYGLIAVIQFVFFHKRVQFQTYYEGEV